MLSGFCSLWVSVVPSLIRIIGPVRGLGALGGTQYVELVWLGTLLGPEETPGERVVFLAALVGGFLTPACCGWWLFLVGCGCGLSVA